MQCKLIFSHINVNVPLNKFKSQNPKLSTIKGTTRRIWHKGGHLSVIGLTDDFHYVTTSNPHFSQQEKSIGRSRKHKHCMTTSSSLLMALPAATSVQQCSNLRGVLAGREKLSMTYSASPISPGVLDWTKLLAGRQRVTNTQNSLGKMLCRLFH